MAVKSIEEFGSLSEIEIAGIEKKLGGRLPPDYRAFMMSHNGGVPRKKEFDFIENGRTTSSAVTAFYKFGPHPHASFEATVQLVQGRYPSEVIPIADDPGGNLICLGIRGKHAGKVYFWDHEKECDGGWDNMLPVANSFDEFLKNLY